MTPPARAQTKPAAPSTESAIARGHAALKRRMDIDWAARRDPRAVWTLAVLMVIVGVALMYTARGTTFFFDEWDYVMNRFGGGIQSFLEPHNEHFSLVPLVIYKTLFHLVGMRGYPLYRLVVVLMHLVCVGLVFDVARRRIGDWPALVAATSILCLFTAWQDLLWAFQMGFVGSAMGGLAAWALIDRDTRACDIAAGVALGVALSCSGLGIPFVPGIALELAWQRRPRRLWLVAVPFALYLLWYSHYGVSMVTSNSVIQSPQWIAGMAAAAVGALAGRDLDWGVPLTVVLIVLAVRRLLSDIRVSPRFVGALTTAAAFWVLTGVSRSTIQAPDESRYVYLGAACIVVAAVELLPNVRATARSMAIAALALLATTAMGWETMHNNALTLRQTSATVAAQLGALQLEAARAPAGFSPSPTAAPNITAGLYAQAVASMGSSAADSPATILTAPPTAQAAADAVLLALVAPALDPRSRPVRSAPAPVFDSGAGAVVAHRTPLCLTLRPTAPGSSAALTLPSGGAYIHNDSDGAVPLAMRRFSTAFTPINASIPVHTAEALVVPTDSSSLPWYLELSVPGPVLVCGLAR